MKKWLEKEGYINLENSLDWVFSKEVYKNIEEVLKEVRNDSKGFCIDQDFEDVSDEDILDSIIIMKAKIDENYNFSYVDIDSDDDDAFEVFVIHG